MKRVKRMVVMVLAGIMLCGVMVTANAADDACSHEHKALIKETIRCYNSFSSGTHSCSSGTCYILVNQYSAQAICKHCGVQYTHS